MDHKESPDSQTEPPKAEPPKYLPIPVPFVVGFVLTPEQLRIFAQSHLSDAVYAEAPNIGGYQVALVSRYFWANEHLKQTILCFMDGDEERYLWVHHSLPSWTGDTPKFSYDREKVDQILKKEGDEFVGAPVRCLRWPRIWAKPSWMQEMLRKEYKRVKGNHRNLAAIFSYDF